MFLKSYCSISFIEDILSRSPEIDFLNPNSMLAGKSYHELIDLIIHSLDINTDCTTEKIKEKAEKNPFINSLVKNGRIYSKPSHFTEMQSNTHSFYSKEESPICLYLLSNFYNDSFLREGEKLTGNYFFSTKQSNWSELFEEELITFNTREDNSWNFSKELFGTHNSIVIADPYIFKDKNFESFVNFINNVIPIGLVGYYYITLIGSDNDIARNIIERKVSSFTETLNRTNKVIIDFHVYNGEDFHDRVIITNNVLIYTGIGLITVRTNGTPKKTTWIAFKPFKRISTNNKNSIRVFDIIKGQIQIMKSWIKEDVNPQTRNPLINTYN